jgi:hypothetical protein
MRKALRTPTIQSSRPRYWTPEEDAVLRKFYPGKGWRACQAYLPGRTESTSIHRARKLGLPGPRCTLERKKENLERALRKCLGPCGQMFVSEWKGHRMCRACRGHAERISDDSGTFAPPSRRASAGGRL